MDDKFLEAGLAMEAAKQGEERAWSWTPSKQKEVLEPNSQASDFKRKGKK